jgi:ubiquinone/menaquinone biosynthesis C-methylase UbiE
VVEGLLVDAVFQWLLAIFLVLLLWFGIIIRLVRRYWHFPIPHAVERFIDNPFRRWIQPPREVIDWAGLTEGAQVLEIGPGSGTFTLEAARRLAPGGRLCVVDIQPEVVGRLEKKLYAHGVGNAFPRIASAYELPFPGESFDLVFMVAVLGEIPDRGRALREIWRVLKDGGILSIGEVVVDPDYHLRKTVIGWCEQEGFKFFDAKGRFAHYVVRMKKYVKKA